jgi:heme/copper-type cytochrome/quinol oxidase subunit 4
MVIAGLAALTAVEFWLSSAIQSALPYLTFIALVKAGLIVYYFMHVSQVWKQEPHE